MEGVKEERNKTPIKVKLDLICNTEDQETIEGDRNNSTKLHLTGRLPISNTGNALVRAFGRKLGSVHDARKTGLNITSEYLFILFTLFCRNT